MSSTSNGGRLAAGGGRPHFVFFVSFVADIFVAFVATLFVLFVARADAQEPLRVSLEEAQTRALAASHRLAELQAREAAAAATADLREAASRPNVSLQAGYLRTNHVDEFSVPGGVGAPPRIIYPDIPDNFRTRLDLQWPIFTSGRAEALERAARAEAGAAGSDLAAARADLRLEVARAYWALVTARASTAVLQRAVERAEVHVEDVRSRFAAGFVPPNEVTSAMAQASRQRVLLIEARNQRDVAASELARLLGESLLGPIEPTEPLDRSWPRTYDLETTIHEAQMSRDDRRALEQRATGAEERRIAAAGTSRPTVAVTAGYDYARPNPRIFPRSRRWDDSWDAGVSVAWPLWDGGRADAELAEATAAAAAAHRRLDEFDSVLSLEIRQRILELESGRAAETAALEAVDSAMEAQRVVGERFAAGVVPHTEVLDAQLALLQAELERTRLLASLRLAEARLARAAGR